ncbi:glycosyltransferase [Bifidobacterium sp. SO4]|uniref:glycosyltransferase family 2 protein n=1 Tax=Bifidobacterium sp. SO4 TaxID=2809030 RepID=UPI001BDCDF11|nr:glycosyltransferase [Bifidobacterium sp. SO4]MBT1169954.1 glycosyltransferase [Bifidobacterium sp. SO4]
MMSENPLISVVIPVYNVEKYLQQCVDSVLEQTYKHLEIILVDDGSTDSSGEMCDRMATLDDRIRVVHKRNAGLGMARNSGLDVASGQYVMFLDSDDFVDSRMVEELYAQLRKTGADTSYCGYNEYYGEGRVNPRPAAYDDRTFRGTDIINHVLLEMVAGKPEDSKEALLSMSSCFALFSMDVIGEHHVRFPSERQFISEDIIFDIAYLQHSSCVTYIARPLYFYRYTNSSSLTHSFNARFLEQQKTQYARMNEDLETICAADTYRDRLDRYFLGRVRHFIGAVVAYGRSHKEYDAYAEVRRIVNDEDVRTVIARYPYRRNPFQLRMMNMCIAHRWIWPAMVLVTMKQLKKTKRF